MHDMMPCPFCGGLNVRCRFMPQSVCVSCEDVECGVLGPDRATADMAVEAWNRRSGHNAT